MNELNSSETNTPSDEINSAPEKPKKLSLKERIEPKTLSDVIRFGKAFIAIFTLIGMLFGAFFYVENRYALFQELRDVRRAVKILDLRFQISNKNLEISETDASIKNMQEYEKKTNIRMNLEIENKEKKKKKYNNELMELESRLTSLLRVEDEVSERGRH